MEAGFRRPNDFCWINVMTPDVPRARAFFGALLGWEYGEMPGVPGGQLVLVGDRTAGAMLDLEGGAFPPGMPPAIGVLVRVEDADAAASKARSLGARVDDPMDVLENGRMAICTDPTGAIVGLWQARAQKGMDVDARTPGAPGWFDLLTHDLDRAVDFYTALFGWTVEERSPAPGATYRLFKLDGRPVAGAVPMGDKAKGISSNWSVSFTVRDADEAVARARELGGEICIPVGEVPGVGRWAMLKSPQGVAFHVTEWRT